MYRPGYFLISEDFTDEFNEKEWNALFDGLAPNEITGQTRISEHRLIKVELEGPEIEPDTEYRMTFTYEKDGSVSARLNEVSQNERVVELVG